MSWWSPTWEDPSTTVLALLLCGHVLADFLFQTDRMVREKERSARALVLHAAQVALVQAVVVLPCAWSARGAGLVAAIAPAHLVIDWLRIRLERVRPRLGVWWFLADQGAHVAVLLAAWRLWEPFAGDGPPTWLGRAAVVVALVVFNAKGGSAIVAKTLSALEIPLTKDDGPPGAGRKIGILERWMILGLVWAGQWGAVGLVLTAKSIARFKRMDEQAFAEVYLVGTMTSVLVAMSSGALLQHAL